MGFLYFYLFLLSEMQRQLGELSRYFIYLRIYVQTFSAHTKTYFKVKKKMFTKCL